VRKSENKRQTASVNQKQLIKSRIDDQPQYNPMNGQGGSKSHCSGKGVIPHQPSWMRILPKKTVLSVNRKSFFLSFEPIRIHDGWWGTGCGTEKSRVSLTDFWPRFQLNEESPHTEYLSTFWTCSPSFKLLSPTYCRDNCDSPSLLSRNVFLFFSLSP
jgi:hypothetical protein